MNNVIFLRELPVLHTIIDIPGYTGRCIGAYLICENGKAFISIFCDNEKQERALLGYNIFCNSCTMLSLYQIKTLCCKIANELDEEMRFNRGIDFKSIYNYFNNNSDLLSINTIYEILGIKVFYGDKTSIVDASLKMVVEEKDYNIDEMTGAIFEDFSCVFTMKKDKLDENIKKVSLKNEIELVFNLSGNDYREKGIIIKYYNEEDKNTFKVMSYTMFMLGHIMVNNLKGKNIRNPLVVVKYMLESIDIDIKKVEISNEIKANRTFLIVMAIKNIRLPNETCSIGDVRIGEKITTNVEFENYINKQEECVAIWTDQCASDHYEAYLLAKEKIMRVVDFIVFFSKNDCIANYYGTGDICKYWEAANSFAEIKLMDVAYIEDCIDRQAICVYGNNIVEPHVRNFIEEDIKNLELDWIENSYDNCIQEKNDRIKGLYNSIHWVNKVGTSVNSDDSIIYCITALEFCLYKEKGNNIVEDLIEKYEIDNRIFSDIFMDNLCIELKKDEIKEVDSARLNSLENEIISYIYSRLKESSFFSKLKRMVARINAPISEEEFELIKYFRKKRNEMIHGDGIEIVKESSIQKMTGIVYRLITYKLLELINGAE